MDPVILVAAREMRNWTKRYVALRKHARATIEAEGGAVQSMAMIGMLLRSPFPAINVRPVYLKIKTSYPADSGHWYLCGAEDGVHWVWSSDTGATQPPVKRNYELKVDSNVIALPRWLSVVLYVLFLAIIFGGLAVYLAFT